MKFLYGTFFLFYFLIKIGFVVNAQTNTEVKALRVDLVLNADKVWKNGLEVNVKLADALREKKTYQTALIDSKKPNFSWILKSKEHNICQAAYQIMVATTEDKLNSNIMDIWNSGKVMSNSQTGIAFKGKGLKANTVYYWRVKIWDNKSKVCSFSKVASFLTDSVLENYRTPISPIVKTLQNPITVKLLDIHTTMFDFGKDAFGQFCLDVNSPNANDTLRIHFGESMDERGGVDRHPKGAIRYKLLEMPLQKGVHHYNPIFNRNLMSRAVHMPNYIGEVMPFRYVEIETKNSTTKIFNAKRYIVHYVFNDKASNFASSNTILNQVWDLCKYTMKATSFTGYYIDGDRERTPYEADALINQLSHYATDAEYNMAKRSLEYLVYHATWPTEWSLQNLLIAWNDYLYSGDIRTVEKIYKDLKPKTLEVLARTDGLISTRNNKQDKEFAKSLHLIDFDGKTTIRDIVDWPQKGGVGLRSDAVGETDNFVFTDYNSVVNAFHYESLVCLERLAFVLGKQEDVEWCKQKALLVKKSFQNAFIDKNTGLVKDGETTLHSSLHANMMALAFDLVPPENVFKVVSFIQSRGMACSVYGAQFLLDAIYKANNAAYGLKLLTLTDKRSWYNMLRTGSTMTTEAWDMQYKGNQDWNHAWGSAPANIIVENMMGVKALKPSFETIEIKSQVDTLSYAMLDLATLRGDIHTEIHQTRKLFNLKTIIPPNTKAVVYLPKKSTSDRVFRNGRKISASTTENFWIIKNVFSGEDNWKVEYHDSL